MEDGEERVLRGDVDDVAAEALVDEHARGGLRHEERALGHHVVLQVPVRLGGLQQRLGERQARIVHDEVEAAEGEHRVVDRTLHRVISFEPAECAEEDGRIVKRLKRGFTWHDRVLRAEEVIAKRFQ